MKTQVFFTIAILVCLITSNAQAQHKFELGETTFREQKQRVKELDRSIAKMEKTIIKDQKIYEKDSSNLLEMVNHKALLAKMETMKLQALYRIINDTVNASVQSNGINAYGSSYFLATTIHGLYSKNQSGNNDHDGNSTNIQNSTDLNLLLANEHQYRSCAFEVYPLQEYGKPKAVPLGSFYLNAGTSQLMTGLIPGKYMVILTGQAGDKHYKVVNLDYLKQTAVPENYANLGTITDFAIYVNR